MQAVFLPTQMMQMFHPGYACKADGTNKLDVAAIAIFA